MTQNITNGLDSLNLSSGLRIEFFDNNTNEIDSANYSNYGEPCFQHENTNFNQIFLSTINSIIFLAGIIGNGLIIIVVGYQKKRKNITDKYRLHLSVASLLFVITLPFWSVDAAISWYFGNFLCKAICIIYTVSLYSSVLILAFISLDRYLAIIHATNSQRPRKLLAEKEIYVSVWLLAMLLTVPNIIFANIDRINGKCLCDHLYPHKSGLILFRFLHILVGLVLPGLIILTCYCIITSKLSHSKNHQKCKALRIAVILTLTFITYWLPYYIGISIDTFILLGIIKPHCSLESIIHKWISITRTLTFFHYCLNPILYAFLDTKFKTSTQNTLASVHRESSLNLAIHVRVHT